MNSHNRKSSFFIIYHHQLLIANSYHRGPKQLLSNVSPQPHLIGLVMVQVWKWNSKLNQNFENRQFSCQIILFKLSGPKGNCLFETVRWQRVVWYKCLRTWHIKCPCTRDPMWWSPRLVISYTEMLSILLLTAALKEVKCTVTPFLTAQLASSSP